MYDLPFSSSFHKPHLWFLKSESHIPTVLQAQWPALILLSKESLGPQYEVSLSVHDEAVRCKIPMKLPAHFSFQELKVKYLKNCTKYTK